MLNSKKAVFLIFCLGFIVYSNTFNSQFVWDDQFLVVQNDYIKDWSYLPQIFTSGLSCFSPEIDNYYRPVQSLSYALDYRLWRLNTFGYHLSNILLHLGCAFLVYLLIELFLKQEAALLTSLLFLLHPLNTQVAAFISGRADSLAMFFFLGSFYCLIKGLSNSSKGHALYIFSNFLYLLALLSKEISIIFPIIFLFYLAIYKREKKRGVLKYCLPYFILSLSYILLRLTVLNFAKQGKALFIWQSAPLIIRILGFGKIALQYLKILLFPINLHLNYEMIYPKELLSLELLLSLIVLAILGVIFWKVRHSKNTRFFLLWFFVLLLPTANIILPLGVDISPHWLYLPAIAAYSLFAAYLVKLVQARQRLIKTFSASVIAVVLIWYSLLTYQHNFNWRDNITLYKYELRFSPDDCILHNNLGNEYRAQRLYQEAEQEYLKAIALQPNYPSSYNNLGLACLEQGRLEEAVANFKKSLQLHPLAIVCINLGRAYQQQGKWQLAEASFQQSVRLDSGNALSYYQLGILYTEQGQAEAAIIAYQKAIETDSAYLPAYYNLGYIFRQKGELKQAQFYWQKALEISPTDVFVRQALSQLEENE